MDSANENKDKSLYDYAKEKGMSIMQAVEDAMMGKLHHGLEASVCKKNCPYSGNPFYVKKFHVWYDKPNKNVYVSPNYEDEKHREKNEEMVCTIATVMRSVGLFSSCWCGVVFKEGEEDIPLTTPCSEEMFFKCVEANKTWNISSADKTFQTGNGLFDAVGYCPLEYEHKLFAWNKTEDKREEEDKAFVARMYEMDKGAKFVEDFMRHMTETWDSLAKKYESEMDGMGAMMMDEVGRSFGFDNVSAMLDGFGWMEAMKEKCRTLGECKRDSERIAVEILDEMFPKEWVLGMDERGRELVSRFVEDICQFCKDVSSEDYSYDTSNLSSKDVPKQLDEEYEKRTGVTLTTWCGTTGRVNRIWSFMKDTIQFMRMRWAEKDG